MKVLLLLFVIPIAFAGKDAPHCEELKSIIENYEKKLQQKRIGSSCNDLDIKDLSIPEPAGPVTGCRLETLKDYKCKDLSALELQLKSAENELALYKGLSALQLEIEEGANQLKKTPKPEIAQDAAQVFMDNVQVAKSLELFLQTQNKDQVNFFQELSRTDKDWGTPNAFASYIKSYCRTNKMKKEGICSPDFVVSESTYREIKDFVKIGSETQASFSLTQVDELSEALSLENYSYTQMAEDLKTAFNAEGKLTTEGLDLIKSLPELKNDSKYEFLKDLKTAKDSLDVQTISSRFQFFLGDLKKRHEWEMKSKLSLITHQHADKLIGKEEICGKALQFQEHHNKCIEPLVKQLSGTEQAIVVDLIKELDLAEGYRKRLDEMAVKCVPDKSMSVPQECLGLMSQQTADLQDKIYVLSALKEKILEDSGDQVTLRNYAVEKYHSLQCAAIEDLTINHCEVEVEGLSQEAIGLAGNVADITFVLAGNDMNTDITDVCDDDEVKVYKKDRICAYEEEDPAPRSKTNTDHLSPISPLDSRNTTKQALLQTAGNIINALASTMFAPRPPPYPMIPYAPAPTRAMSISDQIMVPYAVRGYGAYDPGPSRFFNTPLSYHQLK